MIWLYGAMVLLPVGIFLWVAGRATSRPSRDILLGKTFGKLLDGERQEVLAEMRQLYQETQQDVGIGLALGILLRHLGKNQLAIRTHRSLISRTNLESDLKALILTELSADYLASGLLDRAKVALEEGMALGQQDELMTRFGERIYSRLENWDAAFQVVQNHGKRSGQNVSARLALIRNDQGCHHLALGQMDQAQAIFRKATQIDPGCLPAYLNRARILREQGQPQKALKLLLRKFEYFQGQEWLALKGIKACALALDQPAILVDQLEKHLECEPEDWRTMLVYAGMEKDFGNYTKSADWYLKALQFSPQTLLIHQRLWAVMLRSDDADRIMKTYQNQVREDMVFSAPYECQGCHYHSRELVWRCPSCFRNYSFRERAL